MKNINSQYRELMASVLHGGKDKEDRTKTGTRSLFAKTIEHSMALGFPLLTGKRVSFNMARTELLWILQGRTDMKYLHDNKVHYWDPDYKRSGRTDGDLGPVYGAQWRDFNGIDQLSQLLSAIKTHPHSRRLLVNAWNPADIPRMVLPPCHYGFQVYINNGVMDLMWLQRSVDVFLGLPYDIAMYGLLLEMLAKGAGYTAGRLIGQLGDCHLYNTHLDQAAEFIARPEVVKIPTLELKQGLFKERGTVFIPTKEQININNYVPLPAIKAPLEVGT